MSRLSKFKIKPLNKRALNVWGLVSVTALVGLGGYMIIRSLAGTSGDVANYTSGPSGIDGAGFQNVVAVDPNNSNNILSGSDVAGIWRSTDGGAMFNPVNKYVSKTGYREISGIVFSKKTPGKVYAGIGNAGNPNNGGVIVSQDSGASWAMQYTPSTSTPGFAGGDDNISGSQVHPRSVGRTVALDESGATTTVYAATFNKGVFRSTDDTKTWKKIADLGANHSRSMVLDPQDPKVAYVGTKNDGLWKSTDAKNSGTFTKLTTPFTSAEELVFVGNTLYVAAGQSGIYKSSNGGTSWQAINSGIDLGKQKIDDANSATIEWISIDGYVENGNDIVYAGNTFPRSGAIDPLVSVVKTTNGGTSWASITNDRAKVACIPAGYNNTSWWLVKCTNPTDPTTTKNKSLMMGGFSYVASSLQVDPATKNVFVAGRSGVWKYTQSNGNWQPLVHGMQVTVNRVALADPKTADSAYVANTDWIFFASKDGFKTFVQKNPGGFSAGFGLAADSTTTPSTLYIAGGERDANTQGEVLQNTNPNGGGNWVSENLSAVAGGNRALGVAVGKDGSSNRVLLAAVEESTGSDSGKVGKGGLYRKVGTGAWTKLNTSAFTQTGRDQKIRMAVFSWQLGSQYVYVYDRKQGVWRSNDYGVSWELMWNKPNIDMEETTGHVVIDPLNANRLFVQTSDGNSNSANTGVFVISNAQTGVKNGSTDTLNESKIASYEGPIAYSKGKLYAADNATVGKLASLQIWDGNTWQNIADDYYQSNSMFPFTMSVDQNGKIYVANRGNGVTVVTPNTAPPPPTDTTPPTVSLTSPTDGSQVSGASVSIQATASDNVGVTKVEFLIDDEIVDTKTTSPYSYTWDSGAISNGSHTILAKVYDGAGNSNVAQVTVNVNNVQTVTVHAPTNLKATPGDGKVILSWDDTKNTLPVEYIASYQKQGDSTWTWQSAGTNKTVSVNGLTNGDTYSFRIRSRYTDAQGNKTASTDTGPISSTPLAPPPTNNSDLNNDSKVDVFDLSILLSKWNTNDSKADINKDGKVDVFDLSILLSKWGS